MDLATFQTLVSPAAVVQIADLWDSLPTWREAESGQAMKARRSRRP